MLLIAGHFACAAFRNANLFKLETFFPGTKSIGVASYWALGKTKKEITIIETTNKRKEMTFDSHCDWLPAKRRHQQVHARASWKPPSQKMFIGPSENYWFSLFCLLSKFYWNKTVCIEYVSYAAVSSLSFSLVLFCVTLFYEQLRNITRNVIK